MESNPKYQILLTWSEQQQTFVAEVPELLACRATGATYAEALEAIQETMHRWLEATKHAGQELPLREKRPLTEERERLLARASEEGRREAASGGPSELLDETGLQIYAGQQMEALLITEPIETENTSALYTVLREAYVASYRAEAHKRGWKIPL